MHLDQIPQREHLTRAEAARRLDLSVSTLARWASEHRGPRYSRSGDRRGRVWYAVADLDAWVEGRKVSQESGGDHA